MKTNKKTNLHAIEYRRVESNTTGRKKYANRNVL